MSTSECNVSEDWPGLELGSSREGLIDTSDGRWRFAAEPLVKLTTPDLAPCVSVRFAWTDRVLEPS